MIKQQVYVPFLITVVRISVYKTILFFSILLISDPRSKPRSNRSRSKDRRDKSRDQKRWSMFRTELSQHTWIRSLAIKYDKVNYLQLRNRKTISLKMSPRAVAAARTNGGTGAETRRTGTERIRRNQRKRRNQRRRRRKRRRRNSHRRETGRRGT